MDGQRDPGGNESDARLSPARFADAFSEFLDAVISARSPSGVPLRDVVLGHLGASASTLPVLSEEFDAFEQPNVQVALDSMLASVGRAHRLVGISTPPYMETGLASMLGEGSGQVVEGPPSYVNFHLAHGQVLPCVRRALYTVTEADGRPVVVGVFAPEERMNRPRMRVEVMAEDAAQAADFLAELQATIERENVYRGHVISLSPSQMGMGPQTLVAFHELPTVTRDDVILPLGRLEVIERQTIGFSAHATTLLASGRSLKRGLLLHGPPGTGKTMTLMYLIGQMPGRTALLATGLGMGMIASVMQMARVLQPAMVVLDDVDLIAQDRFSPHGGGPLLFELLNELDGLRDDCDVIFALTTNRPEVLEVALTARPGRIDLAVELPLPDADGRRKLLEVHARGLTLKDVDLDAIVRRTDGASPAFIKELLRKAVLLSAIGGRNATVTQADLDRALDELDEGGALTRRLLGIQREMHERASGTMPFSPGMMQGAEPTGPSGC